MSAFVVCTVGNRNVEQLFEQGFCFVLNSTPFCTIFYSHSVQYLYFCNIFPLCQISILVALTELEDIKANQVLKAS